MFWADFQTETRQLSFRERGAYALLLAEYWVSGGALPSDLKRIHRALGITSKGERKIVEHVLSTQFRFTADGWVHDGQEASLKICRESVAKASAAGKTAATARYAKYQKRSAVGKLTAYDSQDNQTQNQNHKLPEWRRGGTHSIGQVFSKLEEN